MDDTQDREDGGTPGEPRSLPRRVFSSSPVRWGLVGTFALLCAGGGYLYYMHQKYFPSTQDAYVEANIVHIAPVVGGLVTNVPVTDQQAISKGDMLLRLDKRPYHDKVDEAQAALASARQQVAAEAAAVDAAEAAVKAQAATLQNDRAALKRAKNLAANDNAPQSRLDDARAAERSARADLSLAKARLAQARKQLGKPGHQNSHVQQAVATLKQAKLDLEHADVRAPCDGYVSNLSVRPGDVVSGGEPQGVLVCDETFWVYANFKETELRRIRPGQTVTINIDMYPNHTFHGIVESVNSASGTAFSLLPAENATGNWVKVTQRVPVRILVLDPGPNYPLRVQTSATVTVGTGKSGTPAGLDRGVTLSDAQARTRAMNAGLIGQAQTYAVGTR